MSYPMCLKCICKLHEYGSIQFILEIRLKATKKKACPKAASVWSKIEATELQI